MKTLTRLLHGHITLIITIITLLLCFASCKGNTSIKQEEKTIVIPKGDEIYTEIASVAQNFFRSIEFKPFVAEKITYNESTDEYFVELAEMDIIFMEDGVSYDIEASLKAYKKNYNGSVDHTLLLKRGDSPEADWYFIEIDGVKVSFD